MLATQWHLIDESYGWPALGFSAAWMAQFAKNCDDSRRFCRNLRENHEHLTLVPVAHE